MTEQESQAKKIANTRMMRERQEIDSVLQEYEVQWIEGDNGVQIKFSFKLNGNAKTDSVVQSEIALTKDYPFYQPLIRFHLAPGQIATFNHDEYKEIDFFCSKTYTPKMTIAYIIPLYILIGLFSIFMINCIVDKFSILIKKRIAEYGRKNIQINDPASRSEALLSFTQIAYDFLGKELTLLAISLFAILIRLLVGLGSYSGFNDGPTFGDYEAQRHWMEITLNSPMRYWYVETLDNDLTYWRIDYPPLSAYVSLVFGYLSSLFDPASVAMLSSRGYETPSHKNFMRISVLVSEILFLFPSLYLVVSRDTKKFSFPIRAVFFLLALLAPPFILIDHAHFQYNAFMHGLVLWALHFASSGQLFVSGILFSLALNFKQMGLYYSLAFFVYILGYLAIVSGFKNPSINKFYFSNSFYFFFRILVVGVGVILTFCVMWLPWIFDSYLFTSLVSAIFPVHRGLYQLKVANFWCFSNVFIKWQQLFDQSTIILLSIALTLAASLPSMYVVFQKPKFKYMKFALFNIAMSFFIFSYHVHEKTILIPLLPLTLCIRMLGIYYLDFVTISSITLYPLLREDKQLLSWAVLTISYHLVLSNVIAYMKSNGIVKRNLLDSGLLAEDNKVADSFKQKHEKQGRTHNNQQVQNSLLAKILALSDLFYKKIVRKALYALTIVTLVAEQYVTPPANYPYLFPLCYAMIGFAAFSYIFLTMNMLMIHQYTLTKTKIKILQQKQD